MCDVFAPFRFLLPPHIKTLDIVSSWRSSIEFNFNTGTTFAFFCFVFFVLIDEQSQYLQC